jgi:catalase
VGKYLTGTLIALPIGMMSRWLGLVGLLAVVGCSSEGAPDNGDDPTTDEAPLTQVSAALGEKLEPNEAVLVKQIADAATAQVMQARDADPQRVARRDAHPKAHGCVKASFTLNADVPADLRVGTFAQPSKKYDAWIRFSNGSKKDDRESDARGMAMKLLNAEGAGARLLTNEDPNAKTHDLVLTNHHTFFITNLVDYTNFMNTVTENKGNPLSFFISWNPFNWHLREAWLARNFTTQPISSPTTARYFSATPYALGSNKVVKYSATPCAGADVSGNHADNEHFLGAALKEALKPGGQGACFDFAIQKRGADMSVEDSTVTWEEEDSPFVKIAKINIAPQTFDSDEQQRFCENLSFTPWHATDAHRPLGSMNRTRKVVYEATSAARHRINGVPRIEPSSL